jgi:hypothetical protein
MGERKRSVVNNIKIDRLTLVYSVLLLIWDYGREIKWDFWTAIQKRTLMTVGINQDFMG